MRRIMKSGRKLVMLSRKDDDYVGINIFYLSNECNILIYLHWIQNYTIYQPSLI